MIIIMMTILMIESSRVACTKIEYQACAENSTRLFTFTL